MRQNNLKTLPRICFTPVTPSQFQVRKQPKPFCYSTIEAIHHTIELLGPSFGFDLASRAHDNMLEVFDSMVDQHIALNAKARAAGRTARFRLKRVP
jgi:DTW domain-containing protein YfiP